jgi:hypothetical protein
VQQIGFRVFAKKTAPGTAANKRENLGASAEFLQHFMIALPDARRERPLHHLRIGGGGQIGASKRRVSFQIAAGRGNFEPIRISLQGGEKIGEPAVLVAVFMRSRPDAELFHIVAHGSDTAGMFAGSIAQIRDDILDFAEGNEIAQSFLAGIKPHGLALVFGDVGTKEFFRFKARGEEMHVVHERVGNVRGSKNSGKLGLPDALGEPRARRNTAEVFFDIGGQTRDLFALIFGGDGNQDRFVKTAANEFDLTALDESSQASEILRPMLFDPCEEWAGIVKAEVNFWVRFQMLDEGKIRCVVGLFENMLEIATGLVRVNEQGEMEFLGHGGQFFPPTS